MTHEDATELLDALLDVIGDKAYTVASTIAGDYENQPNDVPARSRLVELLVMLLP